MTTIHDNRDLDEMLRAHLRTLGKVGGTSGVGSSKVRGGAAYYRTIQAIAAATRREKRARLIAAGGEIVAGGMFLLALVADVIMILVM